MGGGGGVDQHVFSLPSGVDHAILSLCQGVAFYNISSLGY